MTGGAISCVFIERSDICNITYGKYRSLSTLKSPPRVSLFCRFQSRDAVRSNDILATTGYFPRDEIEGPEGESCEHTMTSYIRGVHFVTYGVCIFLIIKGGKSARKARRRFSNQICRFRWIRIFKPLPSPAPHDKIIIARKCSLSRHLKNIPMRTNLILSFTLNKPLMKKKQFFSYE